MFSWFWVLRKRKLWGLARRFSDEDIFNAKVFLTQRRKEAKAQWGLN
jgi:hypothetical protein